jgi:hypothetical protein
VPDFPAPRPAPDGAVGPSRRSVVVAGLGGVAAVALSACTSDPEPGSRDPASPTGVAPDVSVATTALAEIRAAHEAVTRTLKRFPATRPALGSLAALHQTHAATLVDAVPARATTSASPRPYAVPRNRDKALAALATHEQRLHDTLDGLALRAQSGQFARLLASMGAAVHQRLAAWPA